MQGPTQLDLAKTLAGEHRGSDDYVELTANDSLADRIRQWTGQHMISFGERLTARPTDLQLKVSTGPPCP